MPSRRTILRGAVAGALGGLVAPRAALAADAPPAPTLLSLRKPVTASSVQSAAYPASAAVDGNPATRWSSQFSDAQWIQIDLGRRYTVTKIVLGWEAAYAKAFEIRTSVDGVHWETPFFTSNDTGGTETPINTGDASGFPARYVRMNGITRGTPYGYSLREFQVWGVPYISEPPGSLAQGKLATASSVESAHFPASAAFDGDLTTRWSSQFSDEQWLQVDLGQLYTVTSYKLLWETAYAVEYAILTSADGATWQEQYSTSSGFGGDVIAGSSGYPPVRYVRMQASKRGTQYGYSLWEFAVYGG
ncbi:discoidin domain-containing protein [Dactylosporangium sp. NPDC051484]|uniref:discoidin domain-containing protein n=1 Tax=Dactylosporangium sp. NPDC051484 TaxID=3154942 RepID=UPI00344F4D76